jgi:hypothetical protein
MKNKNPAKYGKGFSTLLIFLFVIYLIGFIFMLLAFLGVQSFDSSVWQRNALPFYALAFLIGTVGLFGIWKHRRWGVYTLAGAWIITGLVNLGFIAPGPIPYKATFLAILLVIAFFLLLLPEWQHLE